MRTVQAVAWKEIQIYFSSPTAYIVGMIFLALAGFFFVRNHHLLGDFFDVFKDSRKAAATAPSRRRAGPATPPPEVDRILQKVSAQGLSSLTES
ncbi:MAG: hypothetical protein IIB89_13055, partial [Chloroflexi bacterium]|nr:hypothetical protein [Chloroflexota bacterium]